MTMPVPFPTNQGLVPSADSRVKLGRLPGNLLASVELLLERQLEDWQTSAGEVVGRDQASLLLLDCDAANADAELPLPPRPRSLRHRLQHPLAFEPVTFKAPAREEEALQRARELVSHVFFMDRDYARRHQVRTVLILDAMVAAGLATRAADDAGVALPVGHGEKWIATAHRIMRYTGMVDRCAGTDDEFPELRRLSDQDKVMSLKGAIEGLPSGRRDKLLHLQSPVTKLTNLMAAFRQTQSWRVHAVPLLTAIDASTTFIATETNNPYATTLSQNCRELRGVVTDLVDGVDQRYRTEAASFFLTLAQHTHRLHLSDGEREAMLPSLGFSLQMQMVKLEDPSTMQIAALLPSLVGQAAAEVQDLRKAGIQNSNDLSLNE